MYNILALAIGALISIMLSVNGRLEGVVGLTNSLIIIHVVGLLTITFIMLIKRERIKIDKKIPIYMFLGGAIGVALTLVNMITISKIGVALTTSIAVFAQLIFSSFIDHYGLFGMNRYRFNKKKLIGFSIVLLGLVIMTVF